MLEYDKLNEEEKAKLRDALGISRIHRFYLEDNNILLMKKEELFEYIFLDGIKKCKDAIEIIEQMAKMTIEQNDIGKDVRQKMIENNPKVIKLSNEHYAYKEA